MNPKTFSTLARAFSRLDDLLPDARNFWTSETGISFDYGRSVGCRGEYEMEYERITLSWGEFLDEDGSYVSLEIMCRTQWDSIRSERGKAEKLAKEKREKAEALERAEFNRLAPARKRERELAELRKLMAEYPTEVNAALFTKLPTTAP